MRESIIRAVRNDALNEWIDAINDMLSSASQPEPVTLVHPKNPLNVDPITHEIYIALDNETATQAEADRGYNGGRIDYLVHLATAAIEQAFKTTIGCEHRGHLIGNQARRINDDVYSRLSVGHIDLDNIHTVSGPEHYQNAISNIYAVLPAEIRRRLLPFPTQIMLGGMELYVRDRSVRNNKAITKGRAKR